MRPDPPRSFSVNSTRSGSAPYPSWDGPGRPTLRPRTLLFRVKVFRWKTMRHGPGQDPRRRNPPILVEGRGRRQLPRVSTLVGSGRRSIARQVLPCKRPQPERPNAAAREGEQEEGRGAFPEPSRSEEHTSE